nr:MAG TPA: hypothetical protein [Bacteriophage sp.]
MACKFCANRHLAILLKLWYIILVRREDRWSRLLKQCTHSLG